MALDDLNVLAAFLTVAKERSFTRAAKRLGVSRSGLSHAVRGLEERLGVRLLARTTRSVAPTEAGEQLISRLDPALGEVESVLDQIVGLRERPTGHVRLLVTPLSATMVLAPKLVAFARRFPDIVLDVTTTQEGRTELVASGFDAGIHLGESIQRDMVAVRVSRDQRLAVVGSPDYFALHPKPNITTRVGHPPMHQPARRLCQALPLGVREGRRGCRRRCERTVGRRRRGPHDSRRHRWPGSDVFLRGVRRAHRSRVEPSCVCWRTGAHRSRAIFYTIRAGASSRAALSALIETLRL